MNDPGPVLGHQPELIFILNTLLDGRIAGVPVEDPPVQAMTVL